MEDIEDPDILRCMALLNDSSSPYRSEKGLGEYESYGDGGIGGNGHAEGSRGVGRSREGGDYGYDNQGMSFFLVLTATPSSPSFPSSSSTPFSVPYYKALI